MARTDIEQYTEALLGGEDAFLRSIREVASQQDIPGIQVPLELGRLLQVLIVLTGARQVLEIGTLFGYSCIQMARVLPPGGEVTTLEVNPHHADVARQNISRAGLTGRVTVLEGVALESLKSLSGRAFDLVFIDADKPTYPEYLDAALGLTRPGSVIVADNVWRGGTVVNPDADDAAGQGIARFNRELARNRYLLSVFIPNRECSDAASMSVVRSL